MDIPIKTCHFLLLQIFKKKTSIFLVNLIGQEIPNGNGRGIARNIKKYYFHFQNLTKNGNKVGTIYKVGTLLYISAV